MVLVVVPRAALAQQDGALSPENERLLASFDRALEGGRGRRARRIARRALEGGGAWALGASERLLVALSDDGDASYLLSFVAEQGGPRDALEARVAARAHLIRGDLGEAEALMSRWAQRQDRKAAALLRDLAGARVRAGELRRAQTTLELARRVLPQDRALLLELAAVYLARGMPAPALALLQSRLQLATEDDEARRRLALVFHAAGRSEEAIGELLRLGTPGDLCSASRVALEFGDAVRAVALARRALATSEDSPSEAAAQRALGFALAQSGQRGAAVQALRRAVALDPSSVEARTRLGELAPESAAPNPGE